MIAIGEDGLVPGKKFWGVIEKEPNQKLHALSTRKQLMDMGLDASDCPAGGVVFYGDALIQFMLGRKLRSRDVVWGGRPHEPKVRHQSKGFLCPRNSFDKFMEKAKQESRSWSKTDLHVISVFIDRVIESSVLQVTSHLKKGIEEANQKYLEAYDRIRDNSSWFVSRNRRLRCVCVSMQFSWC